MMAEMPNYEKQQQKFQALEAGSVEQPIQYDALENLFNLSLDMLCVASLDGYFLILNSAFEATLGHSRQVLLETPFIEFVHPDDVASTLDAVEQLSTGEPVTYFENRYRCKDGSYKWLAWTSVPVLDKGFTYAVARDISRQKEIQTALKNQRDLFDNILSNVPASIFWKDRNSIFLGVNEHFARDAGFKSPDELIGKSDYDLAWSREEADFYRKCDRQVMDSGEPLLNIEESQQQADGKEVSLLTNKVPLRDVSGDVYGMLGVYVDITRRKQMENRLQKSEARLQTLFDSAAEFIFVIDPEGRIMNANRQMYQQSGYKAEEVIGRHIKEFFSEESQDLCDCNFPALRERGYNRADIEFVCKDGRVTQMECSATAIPDEKGEFTSFLIVQRDVTERKRAETALSISEQRFRTVFNSSYQLIGVLDPDGILLEANQTALDLGGLKQEDVVGYPLWDTYWWRYSTPVKDRLKAAIKGVADGKPVHYEEDCLTKGNIIRTIDFTLEPVMSQQDEIAFIILEGRDVTDLKQAQQDTERHHQEMAHIIRLSTAGEMASGMAHELNQPLAALLSYCGTAASLVNSMSSPPEQLGELLERAADQAHRAGEIIRHLREFVSKGDSQRELLDVDQVIREVITFLQYDMQKDEVSVEFYPGCQFCKVRADKIQIEQVLINMVRNSFEAIGTGGMTAGQVVVQSRQLSDDLVEVTVADNGPGVDPAMANALFNPFHTNKESGMGIGLSLSRTIIEAHGGKLWVKEGYQDGALFGFELPIGQ
jgi:two-component system sensor kinase FixL